jgi:mannose-6-phosphate isomerase-like protein (cupin superfamily)
MRTSSESNPITTSEVWPPELDALLAAPSNNRLLLENDRVRVLDTEIQPGDKTPVHTHQWPAVHYVLSWSDFVRRDESGSVLLDTRTTAFAQTPPQVLWGDPLPAHSLENVGKTSLHFISVEQKTAPEQS